MFNVINIEKQTCNILQIDRNDCKESFLNLIKDKWPLINNSYYLISLTDLKYEINSEEKYFFIMLLKTIVSTGYTHLMVNLK